MNLSQLRYFILVARYLSFTAAAKEAHIDQSALSKQIADLETFLGLKLFIRNTRSVQLTAAGAELLKDAIEIVDKADKAILRARLVANGSIGKLRIGFAGSLEKEKDKFPAFIKKFRSQHLDVNLSLVRYNLGPLHQALDRGELDIVFTFSTCCENDPSLCWDKFTLYPHSMPMCVVVPIEHRFASYDKITFSELAHEPFIVFSPSESPAMYEHVKRLCTAHGFEPDIVSEVPLHENVLLEVETGIGISILSRHSQVDAGPNLRLIEIQDCDVFVDRVVAWKKTNPNPLIPMLLQALKELPVE